MVRSTPRLALVCSLGVVGLLGCSKTTVPQPAVVNGTFGEYVLCPEVGVRIRVPKSFYERKDNTFVDKHYPAFFGMKRLPVAYTVHFLEYSASLKKNQKSLKKTDVKIGKLSGVLLNYEEDSEEPDRRCYLTLVFGDHQKSIVVMGVYYKDQPPGVFATLRAAMLSTQLDDSTPEPGSRLTFTIQPSAQLRLVESDWRRLTFTVDGELSDSTPESPAFRSISFFKRLSGNVSRQQWAEESFVETKRLTSVEVYSTAEITIDGMNGFEMLALCRDAEGDVELEAYMVILYDTESIIWMLGTVGIASSAEFLPEFKSMAESVRLKSARNN